MATVAEIIRRQIDEGLAGDPLAALLRLGQPGRDRARASRPGPGRLPRGAGDRSGLARRGGRPRALARGRGSRRYGKGKGKGKGKGEKGETSRPSDAPTWWLASSRITSSPRTTRSGRRRWRPCPPGPGRPSASGHLHNLVDLYGGPLAGQRLGVPDRDQDLRAGAARRLDPRAPADHGVRRWMAPRTCWTRFAGCSSGWRSRASAASCWPTRPRSTRSGPTAARTPSGSTRRSCHSDPLHFGAYRALTRLYRDAERWVDLRKPARGAAGEPARGQGAADPAVADGRDRRGACWRTARTPSRCCRRSPRSIRRI